ncbi:hypothetical protein V1477_007583, partial [Vespula maculifrons]
YVHFASVLTFSVYSAISARSFLFIKTHRYVIIEQLFSREGPMGGAHGRGLLCGSPSFSIKKSNSILVLWFWFGPSFLIQFHRFRSFIGLTCAHVPALFLFFFSSSSRISIHRRGSDISSKGPFHNRLLDANTGKIGRTLTPVSAGTDVVFSGANKSPTPVGPQMQLPPRGGTWVGSTCKISKSMSSLYLKLGDRGTDHHGIFTRKQGMSPCFRTRMIGKTLTCVTAGTHVGVREREKKSYRGLRFDF